MKKEEYMKLAGEVKEKLNKDVHNTETGECTYSKNKMFNFKVVLCNGNYCKGNISVFAENETVAEDMALTFVGERLSEAFPTLDIEYSVVLVDENE